MNKQNKFNEQNELGKQKKLNVQNEMNKPNKLSRITVVLAMSIAVIAIFCTSMGIFDHQIYGELLKMGTLSENLYYGSIAQDIIILPVSILLFALCVGFLLKPLAKTLIVIIGIVWCEFYAFGLYTIQAQYTDLYPLYLAIFGASVYTMITGIVSFSDYKEEQVKLGKKARFSIIGFLLTIPLLMIPVWSLRIAPSIAANTAPEVYGVFILDLGIVFPAIIIIIRMLIMNNKLGKILAGVALIKVFMLCLSWGFAEAYVPMMRGTRIAVEMLGTASFFTVISGILLIPYLSSLAFAKQD